MTATTRPHLSEVLHDLVQELASRLTEQGHTGLAAQVDDLRLFDRCRCEDDFCATFYTAPRPSGAWGPGHENVVLDEAEGLVVLDVVNGPCVCVEVLDRTDVKERLKRVLP